MTKRERSDPAALVADVPRDSAVPRYTRKPPPPVTFVEPWQPHHPDDDSIETVDEHPLPEQPDFRS